MSDGEATGSEPGRDIAASSPNLLLEMLRLTAGEDARPFVVADRQTAAMIPNLASEWEVVEAEPSRTAELVNACEPGRTTIVLPPWVREHHPQRATFESMLLQCEVVAGSQLVVLLPTSVLISRQYEQFRNQLIGRWHLSLIASISGNLVGVHSSFSSTILCLVARSDNAQPTRMFQASEQAEPAVILEDFRRLMRREGGSSRFGFVLREGISGTRFDHRLHDPRLRAMRGDLGSFGSVVGLGDVFTVEAGPRIDPRELLLRSTHSSVRVITGRDIQRDNRIGLANAATKFIENPPQLLKADDVLVRALQPLGRRGGFVWARVHDEDLPAVPEQSTLILRSTGIVSITAEEFVLRYIGSELAARLSKGHLIKVTPVGLADERVPLPDADITEAYEEVRSARDFGDELSRDAATALDSIFIGAEPRVLRTNFLQGTRELRWAVRAATGVKTLPGLVRTQFPYPLAYRWRVAESHLSAGPTREALNSQLDVAEQLLGYLALAGLALARESGIETAAAGTIRAKLGRGEGPTVGDWHNALLEFQGRKFAVLDNALGLAELRSFAQRCESAIRYVVRVRNDEAHQRRVDEVDLPEVCKTLAREVESLFQGADFLADVSLILVEDTRWDALRGTGEATYRRLAGDHPVVPAEHISVAESNVERGSLYIRDLSGALHLMRPFMIGMTCPICRALSVFHVDGIGTRGALLKSLENGHKVESNDDLAPALRAVGLLG
ncbi:hypothetical protein [Mycolicibacterium sp. NCC-Tsukiji]|uniref:hypothetical protein n=1 Tax=Mycolicibacterium sp. NCC-Tsukiji TaxID=2185272 RepID=UPI00107F4E6C|nr:hypothetical protein [Mycolicibacterium sp. NCC-Tsukiji]